MKKITPALLLSSLIVALSPFVASAYSVSNIKDLLQGTVDNILKPVVVILIGLAVLATLWNGFKIVKESGGKDIAKYRTALIMSIIALTVMVSFWGVISILRNTFGITRSDSVLSRIGSNSTLIGQNSTGKDATTFGTAQITKGVNSTSFSSSNSGAGITSKTMTGAGVESSAGATTDSYSGTSSFNTADKSGDAIKTVGGSGNANSNNDSIVSDIYGRQGAGWEDTKQVDAFNSSVSQPTNGFINWFFK
jgi:hypothetical protein